MAFPDYTRTKTSEGWDIDIAALAAAIKAVIAKPFGIAADGVNIVVDDFGGWDAAEKTQCDTIVANQAAAFDPLEKLKLELVNQIRINTDAFLARGLMSGGLAYASTPEGRFDVMAIYTVGVVGTPPAGFWPKKVSTVDGSVQTEFADAAAFGPFFTDLSAGYTYWKESGQVIRNKIMAAPDEASARAAAVDTRTWPWTPP